jgi:hypothetical protein
MGDKIIVDLEAKAEVDSKDVDPEVCHADAEPIQTELFLECR